MAGMVASILKLAAGGLSELLGNSLAEGLVPAAMHQVKQYFQSTDTLKEYYNRSVTRSVSSLEIALKGPRAYYPTREKEFYQKHFVPFEQGVFHPFARQAVDQGMVSSEEELRDKCIKDCEKIKNSAIYYLGLQSFGEKDVQELIEKTTIIDAQLSQNMLLRLQQQAHCYFLVQMLERDNVLLSGIVFHFHTFLQNDQQFSNYLNYLESKSIRQMLGQLQKQKQATPDDSVLAVRVQRLEGLLSSLSAYENSMGAIGKKLDSIYDKTLQVYEVLQRLESQVKTGFNALEERLDAICAMLHQGKAPGAPLPTVTPPASVASPPPAPSPAATPVDAKKQPPPAKAKPSRPTPAAKAKPSRPTPVAKPKTRRSIPSLPAPVQPVATPNTGLSRYRRNVTPSGQLFSSPAASGDADASAVSSSPSTPAISPVFLATAEAGNEDEAAGAASPGQEALDHYLQIYSTFLQDSETEIPATSASLEAPTSFEEQTQEISPKKTTAPTAMPPFAKEMTSSSEPPLPVPDTTKKNKRVRADQISQAFGGCE